MANIIHESFSAPLLFTQSGLQKEENDLRQGVILCNNYRQDNMLLNRDTKKGGKICAEGKPSVKNRTGDWSAYAIVGSIIH
jgi:hypothetical protein